VTPEESRILAVLGWELFMASPGTPLAERMRRPQPGDIVMEISSFGRGWDPNRIGRLVRIEGRSPDEHYIVAPLHDPDQQWGWRQSEFIALPTEQAEKWLAGDSTPVRSRFQPLADYLKQDGRERIEMSFSEIESAMGGAHLPPSARNPRLAHWWENDSGNVQAKAWMTAGYQIEAVDIPGERVRFRAHGRHDHFL
jgi:hypothetical protein